MGLPGPIPGPRHYKSEERMERIRLLTPAPGTCRECGAKHRADAPHDIGSYRYISRFYRKYRRFPTREDALPARAPENDRKDVDRP